MNRILGFFYVLAVLLAAPGGSGRADGVATTDSWPMFRGGPALKGVSPATLPSAPALKWSVDLGAPIKSSAAIVDRVVFLGQDDGVLVALDLETGTEKWRQTT